MIVAHRTPPYRPLVSLAVAVLALAACADGRPDRYADTGQATAAQDSGGLMVGMRDMQGMGRGGTMEQMQAHLRMMDGAGADSVQAMRPMHRQLVTDMIAQFSQDMRGSGSPGNTAWDATIDSLRQDLVRMPQMGAAEHRQFMPAHVARVQRLMDAHRTTMSTLNR